MGSITSISCTDTGESRMDSSANHWKTKKLVQVTSCLDWVPISSESLSHKEILPNDDGAHDGLLGGVDDIPPELNDVDRAELLHAGL